MLIWDFIADTVLGQIVDWIYGQIVGFLGDFFMQMGNMGADLFEMNWVQSIVLFFSYLAWALYGVGLVVAAGEIPRIAGQFGLDTSTKANLMSTMYAAQTAVNMTKTVVQAVAK